MRQQRDSLLNFGGQIGEPDATRTQHGAVTFKFRPRSPEERQRKYPADSDRGGIEGPCQPASIGLQAHPYRPGVRTQRQAAEAIAGRLDGALAHSS